MVENNQCKNNGCSKITILAFLSATIFIMVCIFGEGLGGSLGGNDMCYKYLGCTSGFFGYDAIEHFLFGLGAVWALLWIFQKYQKYSMLSTERWKNVLTIVALIMLTSVLWEFIECSGDAFRTGILGESLVDWKLHINLLSQPTNIDTMGDLFFALIGSVTALLFKKLY